MGQVLEKLRERCRIALREEPGPTLESVLEASAKYGVLYGTVNALFKKWRLYMQYPTELLKTLGGVYRNGYVRLYGKKVKELASSIVVATGAYGQLIETLYSHKWEILKAYIRKPRKDQFYVTIRGVKMHLYLHRNTLVAETWFKDVKEVEHSINTLAAHARITRYTYRGLPLES